MNWFPKTSCRCRLSAMVYALAAMGIAAWVTPACGQASIIPLMQEIDINRGGQARFNLQVANRGTEPLVFSMHAYDLVITDEGIPSPNRFGDARSCVDWITFTPATFELGANEVQIVEGLTHAPKDAVGGYSTFIAAEFRVRMEPFAVDENEKFQAQIDMGQAVSSVLMITARSSQNTVKLEPDSLVLLSGRGSSSEVTTAFSESSGRGVWQASLMVKNTGNIHALATGEISIWMEDARLVERAPLTAGRGYVLPGRQRLFAAKGEKPLADGIYMAKVQLRSQQGQLIQGTFPYSIVKGEAQPGAASEGIRALLRASNPVFSLSKRMLDYSITPDGKRTQGITLKNYGQDTLTVVARAVDWSLDDNGQVVLRPDPTIMVRSCASWLRITPNPIVIPPGRFSTVKVAVTAPSDLDGEYYGGVLFESEQSKQALPTELELPRTLLLTVSSAQGLEYKAEIQSFQQNPVSPLMRVFVVNTVNTGNVHCFAQGKLEIYDLKFNLMFEPILFGGPNDYILPDRVRGYAVPCPGALKPGTYEAVVMLEYHDGTNPVISKLRFDSVGK